VHMSVYLVSTVLGAFLHDESCRVLHEVIVYPDENAARQMLTGLRRGRAPKEVEHLVRIASDEGMEQLVVDDPLLAGALQHQAVKVSLDARSSAIKMFRSRLDEILRERGIIASLSEAVDFRRRVSLAIAKQIITEEARRPDVLIKHAIETIDSIDKTVNILSMRLREWYACNFPVLDGLVEDPALFVDTVLAIGESMPTLSTLSQAGLPESLAQKIVSETESDVESPLSAQNLAPILRTARSVKEMLQTRQELEEYVETAMRSVAPNITALVGPMVGARLISAAGSLGELAQKPSSTIQVLGAERALFRSLRTGASPPKHGIIFQVPLIYSAPYWQRGKIARALAGKLAIAARLDAFDGPDMSATLTQRLEKRVQEIRQQYPEAPTRPRTPKQHTTKRKRPRGRRGRRGGRRRLY